MIVGIDGKIIKKEPTYLHINLNGLIYEVFVSLNCSSAIVDNNVKLFTTQIIKEDSNTLYGFLDLNEKKMFDTVIKINGVGPKVAMAICSTFTPVEFEQIINDKNVVMLKRVPGIGPKGASRILVELSGFVVDTQESLSVNNATLEATMALESLGFKQDQIKKVLQVSKGTDTASLVKDALRKLQK